MIEGIVMLSAKTLQDYEKLPNEAKAQVIDFIESMKARHQKIKPEKNALTIESSFGLLTADHSMALTELDKTIETEGCKLRS